MLKGRVLLLNQNFDILGTIGVARAMRMSLRKENPILIHEMAKDTNCGCGKGVKCLKSGGGTYYPVPSVISLKNFVHINGKDKRKGNGDKRKKIYLRDAYTCQYCSVKKGQKHPIKGYIMDEKKFTLDHVTPKAQGGSNAPNNLVTCCEPCNTRKADRTPEQAKMPLRTQTHKVITNVGTDKLNVCMYLEKNPEWIDYVKHHDGYAELIEELGIATSV